MSRKGINALNKNWNWRGGRTVSSGGYVQVRCVGHPRASKLGHYVFEHILVMERHVGRYLDRKEVVHHINHDKTDNRIENLELTTQAEHMRRHLLEKPMGVSYTRTPEQNKKMSEIKKKWWSKRKERNDREKWSNKFHRS